MNSVRYIIAFILSAGMLYLVHALALDKPYNYVGSRNEYKFVHTSIPLVTARSDYQLEVVIEGEFPEGVVPVARTTKFGQDASTNPAKYATANLELIDSATSRYGLKQNAGLKGDQQQYYFEVRDNVGGLRASYTHPNGEPFKTKFRDKIPTWLIIVHAVLAFGLFFCISLAALLGIELIRGNSHQKVFAKALLSGTFLALVSCVPIGSALNNYKTGIFWNGFPLGFDVDDTKLQLLLFYCIFMTLSSLGSLTGGKLGRDIYGSRVLGLFSLIGLALCGFFALIPHSSLHSETIIQNGSWSVIAFLALSYLIGQIISLRKSKSDS